MKYILLFICLSVSTSLCAQILTRGPYLQSGSQTSVTVRWRTNVAVKSKVTLGTVFSTYPIIVTDNATVTEHIIKVSGLQPDTRYYYTIGTDVLKLQGDLYNFFVTAPADTTRRKISIAAFGDCGRNEYGIVQTWTLGAYENTLRLRNMMASDIMLLLGDNAYANGADTEFRDNFFAAYESSILKNHILFPTPGNHDYANDASRQADHAIPYYNIFSVPDSGLSGGVPSYSKAYYSYDWGNIHFMSLDSYGEEDAGTTRLYDTNGKQVQWIKADLAANTKKWTIAYWHHPPYTLSNHNSNTEAELINIRQNFIQILERNGVDLVLCGHSHSYERSYLLKGHYGYENSFNIATHAADSSSAKYDGSVNSCPYIYPSGKNNHGTVYVVAGSSGAFTPSPQSGYPHNALPFTVDYLGGMLYLEIEGNRLDAKFVMMDSTIGDQFTIIKDANRKDTVAVKPGNSVDIKASWIGNYIWSNSATTESITITPTGNTIITVRDSSTNTCITDSIFIKFGFPASINTINDRKITLYPVPANDKLYINMPVQNNDGCTIQIYDAAGKLLHSKKYNTPFPLSISTENFPRKQQLFLHIQSKGTTEKAIFILD